MNCNKVVKLLNLKKKKGDRSYVYGNFTVDGTPFVAAEFI
jgi:hypothetical protein